MKKSTLFAWVGSLLFLAACGSDNKGSYAPLTNDQKNTFSEVLVSTSRVGQAGLKAAKFKTPGGVNSSWFATEFAGIAAMEDDKQVSEMAVELVKASCEMSYTLPKQGSLDFGPRGGLFNNPFDGVKFAVRVAGNDCPVELSMAHEMKTITNLEFDLTSGVSYRVKNETFRKYNDIVGLTLNGSVKSRIDQVVKQATFKGGHQGSLTSIKFGTIPVSSNTDVTLTQNSISGSMVLTYNISNFVAQLRQVFSGTLERMEVQYFLNSEGLSETQFNDWFEKSGLVPNPMKKTK